MGAINKVKIISQGEPLEVWGIFNNFVLQNAKVYLKANYISINTLNIKFNYIGSIHNWLIIMGDNKTTIARINTTHRILENVTEVEFRNYNFKNILQILENNGYSSELYFTLSAVNSAIQLMTFTFGIEFIGKVGNNKTVLMLYNESIIKQNKFFNIIYNALSEQISKYSINSYSLKWVYLRDDNNIKQIANFGYSLISKDLDIRILHCDDGAGIYNKDLAFKDIEQNKWVVLKFIGTVKDDTIVPVKMYDIQNVDNSIEIIASEIDGNKVLGAIK